MTRNSCGRVCAWSSDWSGDAFSVRTLRESIEESAGVLQVRGVPPLREPAEQFCQQLSAFGRLAMSSQQARQAQRGPQLQGLCTLAAGDIEGPAEAGLCLGSSGRVGIKGLWGGQPRLGTNGPCWLPAEVATRPGGDATPLRRNTLQSQRPQPAPRPRRPVPPRSCLLPQEIRSARPG